MADSQPDIQVFNQTEIKIPMELKVLERLAQQMAQEEDTPIHFIEVVYVDEDGIVSINKEHLERDYITDIITFRYDDQADSHGIEGTLFCCAPRIQEQAKEFNSAPEQEFMRIYIHGILHLMGYEDQSKSQKEQMTARENHYLSLAN